MRILRRFLAVGAVATAIDVGLLVILAVVVGWPPWLADLVAISTATVVSYLGHRGSAFGDAPGLRWYLRPARYASAAVAAGLVDVGVMALLTRSWEDVPLPGLLAVKVVSLSAALLVRSSLFRGHMFDAIRGDQERPVDRPTPPGAVRFSVVIPAYREEEGIGDALARVEAALGHLRADGGLEVIVVDDGSDDDTAGAARAAGADVVIRQEKNTGKGGAVRSGVLASTGRCVAFTDADLSYSPDQLLGLLAKIESGWDVVAGSRQHDDTRTLVAARRLREMGGRVINVLTSVVLLGQYRDTQCGLKAFRSDVAKVVFERCIIDGFAFDVEVFHLVERYRFTLVEVPVTVANATRSTVHVVRDAVRLVRDLFRIRRAGRAGRYEISVADLPPTLLDPARSLAD
jgi:putative flippase GtrA